MAEEFLKLLYKSKPAYQKKLLEKAPTHIITIIGKCAMNILQGRMVLTKSEKEKLRPHKNTLRLLANKKVSCKEKKKHLQKGGRLINYILPTLLKGVGFYVNTLSKVAGRKGKTNLEMKDYYALSDTIGRDAAKAEKISQEMDRKRADGTYEVLDAIQKNPEAFEKIYRARYKAGEK